MSNLSWRDAIIRVLSQRKASLHYTEIADAIAGQRLRTRLGATPAISVNATISSSLQSKGAKSPFVRLDRGVYALNKRIAGAGVAQFQDEPDDTGLISAFGMYWVRAKVVWSPATPKILGRQQPESTPVDFCGEHGVYLLHDGRTVVYVGRATDQGLGVRLRAHTVDRMNGRWDRFSWFGVHPVVAESGRLKTDSVETFGLKMLIVTMEALLIEGLEPPQNRKRGDDFKAVEFLQAPDPDMKKPIYALIDELKAKLVPE